jgi:hypothetical protein
MFSTFHKGMISASASALRVAMLIGGGVCCALSCGSGGDE